MTLKAPIPFRGREIPAMQKLIEAKKKSIKIERPIIFSNGGMIY